MKSLSKRLAGIVAWTGVLVLSEPDKIRKIEFTSWT